MDWDWHCRHSFQLADGIKGQALKVLEEAAEVSVAAATYAKLDPIIRDTVRTDLLDEIADLHQALHNLEEQLGVTFHEAEAAQLRCDQRNISRGRIKEA